MIRCLYNKPTSGQSVVVSFLLGLHGNRLSFGRVSIRNDFRAPNPSWPKF